MKTAIITIINEVNVKISNLDLDIRRKLVKKYEVEKPGARFLPSVKLGRWNGKVSYFSIGGATYVTLLEEIIEEIINHGYDIELVDQRQPHPPFNFNKVDENVFAHKVWPPDHQYEGKPVIARDYQISLVNNLLADPQSMVISATGSGKSLVTAILSHSIEKYGRSIIIVPSKNLVEQTEEYYINLGLDSGVYFGDRKDHDKQHTICTWQSLNALLKNTANGTAEISIQEFIKDVVCVIVDEAHSIKAEVLTTLLNDTFGQVPIRWGFTGTLPKDKFGQMALLTSIGPVVGELQASELQERGILAKCHVNIKQFKDNIEYKDYQSELKYLLETEKRLDKIAAMIIEISKSGNTLVLIDRITPGKNLTSKIKDSVFVSGVTKLSERKEEYNDIKTSDNKVIIASYGVAAVGLDIPRIFNLVLIEPGKSFVRVIQSIGRGLRIASDKDEVQIWDFTSTAKFSKRHLTARKAFYDESNYPYSIEKINI